MADKFEVAKVELGALYESHDILGAAKVELGASYYPPDQLGASKVELGASYYPLAAFDSPKIELGVWLVPPPPPQVHVHSQRFMRGPTVTVTGFVVPSGDQDGGGDYMVPSGDQDGGSDILYWQDRR